MHLSITKIITSNDLKIFLVSFYIFLNFIDRHLSSIFLILSILVCVLDYKNLIIELSKKKRLVLLVLLFSIYIISVGYYHDSSSRELDNYLRFLFLLPLISISVNSESVIKTLVFAAFLGFVHIVYTYLIGDFYIYTTNEYARYPGTSSSPISYANICSLAFMICVYFVSNKKTNYFYALFTAAVFFFILYLFTETRGPLIAILISFIFLMYHFRKKYLVYGFIAFIISMIVIPNPVLERFKHIEDISFLNYTEIKHRSLAERIYYISFGYEVLKSSYIVGVGPQNIENQISKNLETFKNDNLKPSNHLHNEFLDMSVKFGIFSFILLIGLYMAIIKSCNKHNKAIVTLIVIMLFFSQQTQSIFAHHQPISFFITLIYIFLNSQFDKLSTKKNNL